MYDLNAISNEAGVAVRNVGMCCSGYSMHKRQEENGLVWISSSLCQDGKKEGYERLVRGWGDGCGGKGKCNCIRLYGR